ncbi:hypothetical protein D9Q98_000937 [Chlorella vulgaris]|uniref:Magnesium transporter n=1 Tax=Chlorella vulgaris TaxID=3077 RepID=A0A9D4TZY8_CHLVU|nr:hypothetical protein D9Q98_000937 [Chlorella vulgaris]
MDEKAANQAESARIPELWSTLVDTGLSEVQQTLGAVISKRWLHVDHLGIPTLIEVDKHKLVSDLGIRYRDLMLVDPTVPTPAPSTLLIRDRAMVANLESVRMIICSNQVFLLSVPKATNPSVAAFPTLDNPFIRQLCKCLRSKSSASLHELNRASLFDFEAPYELRALEVALATTTNILDREVYELEKQAYPAIDLMATNVSRRVLEDVRQVKQVMGRLISRVKRLKEELEEILEDDADMADMYLGRRAMLLGEEPPPDALGASHHGSSGHSQSSQSIQDLIAARAGHAGDDLASGEHHRPPVSRQQLMPHAAASQHGAAPVGPVPHGFRPAPSPHPSQAAAGMGNASGSRVNLPQPAAEHSSHHDRSGHSGSAHGGSAHGGSTHGGVHGGGGGGRRTPGGLSSAQQTWQRSGATVVRMVRTKKKHKKEKGSKAPGASTLPSAELASASAEATADAAAAAGGAGTTPLAGELLDRADSAPPAMASQERAVDGDSDSSSEDDVIETFIEQPGMTGVDPHDIQDAEDLLESYFIQVDYILRRLLMVNERIDDAEDLVSITLDQRRNELVATDLMVTIISCAFGFAAVVAGVFGMNLHPFPDSRQFFWVLIVVMCGIALGIVLGFVWWVRKRRLLFVPQI